MAAMGMLDNLKLERIEWILLLTAFAAGSVDVVSFASLGGVFASAMTGNFALLAYYVAQSDSQAAMGSVVAPPAKHAPSDHLQILLLAFAMGIQAVVGQTISLTTIVFTTTLTKLVSAIADSIYQGSRLGLKDVKIQSSVVVSYLFGALLAGTLIVHRVNAVVILPFIGVSAALVVNRISQPPGRGRPLTRR
jgi:uncharacterized membrane protein YoaK (UPF0700 family)